MKSPLYDLGLNFQTDKISHHGYHRFYSKYIKRDINKLLEIGIADGHSIKLWTEYCPNAYIFGMDINIEYANEADKLKILRGDQSNEKDLENVILNIGDNIDVIIDDGSHIPEHQLLSLTKLFPSVKDGGIYIIEDIEISYWKQSQYIYETKYGSEHKSNIINVFKNILHLLNKEYINDTDLQAIVEGCCVPVEIIDTISSITFCQNCIIISKKEQYEYQYNNRKYRFSQYTSNT